MTVEIIVKDMNDLTVQELKEVGKLYLKSKRSAFKNLLNTKQYWTYRYDIYMLYLDGRLIGWATRRFQDNVTWVYVQAKHRRKGNGTLLLDRVRQDCSDIKVQPHSTNSIKFFTKAKAI